jgi:hypothetical protein
MLSVVVLHIRLVTYKYKTWLDRLTSDKVYSLSRLRISDDEIRTFKMVIKMPPFTLNLRKIAITNIYTVTGCRK